MREKRSVGLPPLGGRGRFPSHRRPRVRDPGGKFLRAPALAHVISAEKKRVEAGRFDSPIASLARSVGRVRLPRGVSPRDPGGLIPCLLARTVRRAGRAAIRLPSDFRPSAEVLGRRIEIQADGINRPEIRAGPPFARGPLGVSGALLSHGAFFASLAPSG